MTDEQQLRLDLAAAFRLIYRLDMHESVANHLSAAVAEDGQQFLMNRKWMHFSQVTASNLQLLNSDDAAIMQTDVAPDISAWTIHGTLHRHLPRARVIMHVHSRYALALSTLQDPRLLPIDNNTARFYERIAYDLDFGGIATTDEEGQRIMQSLGDHNALMMANHGVTVIGDSVAQAFEQLYYLEKACQTMVLAYSTGQPLRRLPPGLARATAQSWDAFSGAAEAHFTQLKRILDREEPDYRE